MEFYQENELEYDIILSNKDIEKNPEIAYALDVFPTDPQPLNSVLTSLIQEYQLEDTMKGQFISIHLKRYDDSLNISLVVNAPEEDNLFFEVLYHDIEGFLDECDDEEVYHNVDVFAGTFSAARNEFLNHLAEEIISPEQYAVIITKLSEVGKEYINNYVKPTMKNMLYVYQCNTLDQAIAVARQNIFPPETKVYKFNDVYLIFSKKNISMLEWDYVSAGKKIHKEEESVYYLKGAKLLCTLSTLQEFWKAQK